MNLHTGFKRVFGMCVCEVASVVSDSLWPHGLYPARLICLWDSLGKITGVGCHALLQGLFPTQESNPYLFMSLVLAGRFFNTCITWEAHLEQNIQEMLGLIVLDWEIFIWSKFMMWLNEKCSGWTSMLGVEVKASPSVLWNPSLPLPGPLLSTPVSLGAISHLPPPATGIHASAFSFSHKNPIMLVIW